VVAKDEAHIAVATAADNFVVVETSSLGHEAQIGERNLCGLGEAVRRSMMRDREE
jgi:hypothetical protein